MSAAGAAVRPHDLLWLADGAEPMLDVPPPRWATPAWIAAAPAVVRRAAPAAEGLVAVGWRGAARSERCAGHVPAAQVARVVTPEALARDAAWRAAAGASALACLRALARLAPLLDAAPLAWGVTGGVGFTLASGIDVLRADSDLDLLLRAPLAFDAPSLHAVARLLAGAEIRIDVQVETPRGAFALAEWLRTGGAVLLKTAAGPQLVDDPWRSAQRPVPATGMRRAA